MAGTSRPPRLSIGCAVYNSDEERLSRSMESVLGQSFEDFEVIICDNSPDDATRRLCLPFVERDARVRYYHNGVNLGAYPSFWRTFHIAGGDYFKWVADDDDLDPSYFERCVAELDADPALALCYSRVKVVTPEGTPIDAGNLGNIEAVQEGPGDRFIAVLAQGWRAHGFYGVYRTRHLRRTHPVNEDCVRLADILLMAEIALYGTIRQVPEELATYTQHEKDWNDREKLNAAQYEICFPRNPCRGITFPNVLFARELMQAVRYSDLPLPEKERLYRGVPGLVEQRMGGLWRAEIHRAVWLVLNHRIFHNWGEPTDGAVDGGAWQELGGVYRFHAAELLQRFEDVLTLWPGFDEAGIHSARAVLLALMNRIPEARAALEIEIARFPDYEPARAMHTNLEAAAAVVTTA